MVVLGIDPAVAKPLGYGLVAFEDHLVFKQGGLCAYMDIPDILADLKPDLVVIEDQYMFQNYNTAKKLAWSAGKLMGMCAMMKVPNCIINVAHWKKIMGAQKQDKKDKTAHIRRCKEIFGLDLQDDVASAVLIASAYLTENLSCGIIKV